MIDVLTFYGRAPEDKHDDIVMITLYQLNTNANALVSNMAAPGALLRGHRCEPYYGSPWCEHFGLSIQVAF